ncbi:ABC transporter permease subunit [Cohnella zeiphila]|nr:ABC transporter permease subunit [Cohnella zeiphila]
MTPFMALLIAFNYVPLFGWVYAFFNYIPGAPLSQMEFAGLSYFKTIFAGGSELIPVLRNTLVLGFLIVITIPVPAIFAILLNEMRSKTLSKIVQTVSTLPYFLSYVLIFAVMFFLFSNDSGLVNTLLHRFRPDSPSVNPMASSTWAWGFQTLLHLIKTSGFNAIIYIAAIAGIDREQYDAAEVDGAGRFQRIWHVTVPGIVPTLFVLLVLSIANVLTASGFDQYYVFTNPLVADKIDVIDTYSYTIGITQNNYAFATAIGMSKSLVSILILFAANFLSKIVRGTSLF